MSSAADRSGLPASAPEGRDPAPLSAAPSSAPPDAFDVLAAQARAGRTDGNWASLTLRVQLDLHARHAGPTHADTQRHWALVQELLPHVDAATLDLLADALVAARLSVPPAGAEALAACTAPVVAAVMALGGQAACRLAADCPGLPEPQRRAVLADPDPRLAAAFARRADLTRAELAGLAARAERTTWRALLANAAVALPEAVRRLALAAALEEAGGPAGAAGEAGLATALLARPDCAGPDCAPLYPWADPARRAGLRQAIVERFVAVGPAQRPVLPARAQEAVLEAARLGPAALMAVMVDLFGMTGPGEARPALDPARLARQLDSDPSREILAIGLIGLGLPPEHATRALLRLGDHVARDSRRLTALVEIMRSLVPASAAAILCAICPWPEPAAPAAHALMGRASTDLARGASRPAHVPAMAEGGARQRPGAPLVLPAARPASPRPLRRPGSADQG